MNRKGVIPFHYHWSLEGRPTTKKCTSQIAILQVVTVGDQEKTVMEAVGLPYHLTTTFSIFPLWKLFPNPSQQNPNQSVLNSPKVFIYKTRKIFWSCFSNISQIEEASTQKFLSISSSLLLL